MYYIYILVSKRDHGLYTGCTSDLRARLLKHNEGGVAATIARRPLRLIYYEACLSRDDAFRREKYLKSGRGKKYLRNRLRTTLHALWPAKLERPQCA